MNLDTFAEYGLPGLLVAVAAWLLYRLIERGFEFKVPPKR
jgi:hypothetical protein